MKKRLKELDNLFAKLYEDRAKNAVTERNYAMLSGKYQDEQLQLETDIKRLQDTLTKTAEVKDNTERWVALIRKYTNLTELTAPLLNELIDKIVVHEACLLYTSNPIVTTTAKCGTTCIGVDENRIAFTLADYRSLRA